MKTFPKWKLLWTAYGDLWQPIKPEHGNYQLRGRNGRYRKTLKPKVWA